MKPRIEKNDILKINASNSDQFLINKKSPIGENYEI